MKHYERVVEPLRFIVRESFTLSGRGTVALGYIESGTVMVGDDLVLIHEDDRRPVAGSGFAADRVKLSLTGISAYDRLSLWRDRYSGRDRSGTKRR